MVPLNKEVVTKKFAKLPVKKRRRYIRWTIVAGNVLLLLVVSVFILANRSVSQTVRSSTFNSATTTADSVSNPLDQLSSAQIALTAAQAARLPELNAIRNQADSDSITLRVIPNDSVAVAKPQIVSTSIKSKADIKTYITKSGDTISALADKFGVTANSIKWSNNLNGNNLAANVKLTIPPVNGIVYTVKSGDTPASLATRFSADQGQIISYNDAEVSGLKPGEQIIIPNGQIFAPAVSYSYASPSYLSFAASYGGNGYDFGYCTWYVATRISVPTNWGNANTWDNYAAVTPGWTVSSRPVAGAIAQTDGMSYLGHVGYVEQVSADGSQILLSDMNGVAPGSRWGRAGTGWVSTGLFQHYIYR